MLVSVPEINQYLAMRVKFLAQGNEVLWWGLNSQPTDYKSDYHCPMDQTFSLTQHCKNIYEPRINFSSSSSSLVIALLRKEYVRNGVKSYFW